MTFIEICRQVASRCFVTGVIGSVDGATGAAAKVVSKVNEALLEILQSTDDWKFMRASFSFTTEPGRASYPVSEVAGGKALRNYRFNDREVGIKPPGQVGFTPLGVWDFDDYELAFVFGSSAPGTPSVVAIGDDNQLWFGATPDRACVVRGHYTRAAERMQKNADVPPMPEEFHPVIEHLACMKFAAEENLPEVFSSASNAYTAAMRSMRRTQLDEFRFCGPLA